jgi:hypothetical protein
MTDFVPGDLISDHFGPASKTGLVQSDFDITIMKNGVISPVVPTVTEVGDKFYFIKFQSDTEDNAVWSIDILEVPNKSRFQKTVVLNKAETANVIQNNEDPNTIPENLAYIRNLIDSLFQERFRL